MVVVTELEASSNEKRRPVFGASFVYLASKLYRCSKTRTVITSNCAYANNLDNLLFGVDSVVR
jgi:hypothetical protein